MRALEYLQLAALLVCNVLVMNALSWLVTEYKKPLFKVKPFSCRECMAFWLTSGGGFALWVADGRHWFDGIAVAVLAGLVNFYYLKSKIQIEP